MRQELLKILTPADIEEIISTASRLCEDLIRPTSENVLRRLLENNQCPPSIGARFPAVMSAAEQASGRRLSNARSKENTTLRAFIAYQLRSEGYSYSDIGRMLRRDHSTVMHLCGVMRDMLSVPTAYRSEMEMYREFERLLGPVQPLQCPQPSSQTASASALAESPAR